MEKFLKPDVEIVKIKHDIVTSSGKCNNDHICVLICDDECKEVESIG